MLLAALLAAISTWTVWQLNRADQIIQDSSWRAAQNELAEATSNIVRKAASNAHNIASWDETRQQFVNPEYYVYWRTARIRESGLVAPSINAVALYDKRGQSLPAPPASNSMPARLTASHTSSTLFTNTAGGPILYYFFPVYADENKQLLLGYGGLKMNFMMELEQMLGIRNIDLKSLRLDADQQTFIEMDQMLSRLRYKLRPSQQFDLLRDIILSAMLGYILLLGAVSALGYWMVSLLLGRPLLQLGRHIDSLRNRRAVPSTQARMTPWTVAELEKIRGSLDDYHARLEDAQLSLENKNREFWDQAHRDPLSGVFNRRAFERDWDSLFAPALMKRAHSVSFILFDCDHFKPINDTYGHQVGDLILRGIVESLDLALRSGDKLYRLGGDEFATLLYGTDLPQARQVAERCIEMMTRHDFTRHGVKEPVRISIGIAHSASGDADSLEKLHRQADIAMYSAKRPGRGKIAVYSKEMASTGIATLVASQETSAVFQAISSPSLLEMHYQPIIALLTRQVDYYEALVRIRHGGKLISPHEIFPVVEARRLEVEFDLAVISRIEDALKRRLLPAGSGVSINISGPSIVHAGVTDTLLSLAPQMAYYKLVLEITETALITQMDQASTNLNRLRQAGFRIALDDFGSGYSSLGYLSSMPVDLVKFDISMIRQLAAHNRQRLIVENMARMIQDAGYQMVAEGVETELIMEKVTQLGFSHAQGDLLGRPAPFNEDRPAA